jgi:catechol 2,3-dioxygenase-like lactoylglutathione lyase family enzyme
MIDAVAEASNRDFAPPALAVHSLDHFSLAVPELEPAARFYTAFGLRPEDEPDGLRLHARGGAVATLREARKRRLEYLSFSIDGASLQAFQRRLEAAHVALLDPPPGITRQGLWFRDPDDVLIEVASRERRMPLAKSPMEVRITPEGVRRAPEVLGTTVVPRRLGHVLRFTPDVPRAIAFYERILGLRLADRSGDIVAFLYAPHGSDHHVIAFARSSRPGFHHASFEVSSVDEIGIGAMRMAQRGYHEGWGFGRHEAGSNFFHYVRDPWGSFAEYFCDIDYIPAGCAWQSRDLPPELSLYAWGPPVPAYFLENYEGRD